MADDIQEPAVEPSPDLPTAELPEPADEAEAVEEETAEALAYGQWRYLGDGPRTWTNIPVTVEYGDVIGHWGHPGPEHLWEATDEDITRLPDNHRPEDELETARLAAEEAQANG